METHSRNVGVDAESEATYESVPARGRRWSTAFLMVGSALLGATAVAFWNRRTIANLRTQFPPDLEYTLTPNPPNEEEIF